MSKPRIEFQKGGYYHITNRTASGLLLFNDEEDYMALNKRIEHYAEECNIKIIVKSLMPTHYHLLIRQDGDITASKFIQKFSISYVRFFAKRYNHHGSVFGQRFSATDITDVYQMRNTCCYVLVNAYKAGLVDDPLDWQYDDLSLFYSADFWDEETDVYLLESFGSLDGFLEAFKVYVAAIGLFRPPVVHREPKYESELRSIKVKRRSMTKMQRKKLQSKRKIKPYSLGVQDIVSRYNAGDYIHEIQYISKLINEY